MLFGVLFGVYVMCGRKVRVWSGGLVDMGIVVWVEGHFCLEMRIGAGKDF